MLAANTVFNWHVHRLSNGIVTTHAHPFKYSTKNQGENKHTHSEKEYFSIQQLTSFIFIIATIFIIEQTIKKYIEVSKVYDYRIKKNLLSKHLFNRGPPIVV